jgi:hypothetical protein
MIKKQRDIYARQAIQTKYIGPTNVKGSRCKAWAQAGSVLLAWDDALNSEQNHVRAAEALAAKFHWFGAWHMGALPEPARGFCFVCADDVKQSLAFERDK